MGIIWTLTPKIVFLLKSVSCFLISARKDFFYHYDLAGKINIESEMSIIASISDSTLTINCDLYDEWLRVHVLGPHQTNSSHSSSTSQSRVSIDDIDKACANLVMNIELFPDSEHSQNLPAPKMSAKALKPAQPYCERPSKDRSQRFMVSELPLSMMTTTWLQISFGQFNTVLHSA